MIAACIIACCSAALAAFQVFGLAAILGWSTTIVSAVVGEAAREELEAPPYSECSSRCALGYVVQILGILV